ncbi:hypothetical protein MKK69_08395 [Methylobacterium sp. J-026]|uniref:hypothetical protein n=1 Tax=Methylobacterium sp. J-026 TaxID=2836624 RepID=UPI001FB9E769|nr:hypothetical protein [Methylobacterium sp. J-026]MCJ2134083.1 hypothetical protein [Methylobacterium sp. J-026]
MHRTRPAPLLILLAASLPAAAAPQPPSWTTYERGARTDGAPARCLAYRRGAQRAGDARWYVFQVYNDCNRQVRAVCAIAYAPNCDYGRDVAIAARLDAPIAPYGESSPFGHYAPEAAPVPGCFFARCDEADSGSDPVGEAGLTRR